MVKQRSETYDKAEYMVAFVAEFAKMHQLSQHQAFRYLDRFGAIDGIFSNYDAAHTLSFEDVCVTATAHCCHEGGGIQ